MNGTKAERSLVEQMYDAYARLKSLGWREVTGTEPREGDDQEIWIIEAGSSGIHRAKRDENGDFRVWNNYDTDVAHPLLWRAQ